MKQSDILPRSRFSAEKEAIGDGFERVIGLDEAGRGPLAGPVVAGAVMVVDYSCRDRQFKFLLERVNDSKKLSARAREEIYCAVSEHPAIVVGIGIIPPKIIDKINILQATKMAMGRALTNLSRQSPFDNASTLLILDGNFKIPHSAAQTPIIKADCRVFSCAAASIAAKVTRDRLMLRYDKKYPNYGFSKHKGYPTADHYRALKKFGPCAIHRRSFSLVKEEVSAWNKRRLANDFGHC